MDFSQNIKYRNSKVENKNEIKAKAADEAVSKLRSKRGPTPYLLIIITTASIFFVEAAEMIFLALLPPISDMAEVLLDASILTILIFPMLYFYFFKPMKLSIAELEQKEKALRESEEEMKKYSENLEEIVEEKTRQVIQMEKLSSLGELMGGIAHQINNPLVGVVNFSQLALKKMDTDHPLREDVETIRKAGIECRDIINKLLAFSRQSGFELVPLDVNRLIDESLELLERHFGLEKIHIDKFYEEKLPLLMLDATLVKQVFFNIINNARQAMSEDGRLQISTVLIKSTFHDDMVEINFSDNGVGIKKDDLRNVFSPFFTTKDGEGGVGIGLAIVQDIVNRHSGEIKVESEEGAGTTFTVRFQVNPVCRIRRSENL
jgi:signal transduction histidine kinase